MNLLTVPPSDSPSPAPHEADPLLAGAFGGDEGIESVRTLADAIVCGSGNRNGGRLAVALSVRGTPDPSVPPGATPSGDHLWGFADAERDAAPHILTQLRSLFAFSSGTGSRLRFFASVPVVGAGGGQVPVPLGTLFVGDGARARVLNRRQEDGLVALGQQVGALVALETHKRRLESDVIRLSALATTDGLTGLANRRTFSDRLATCVEYARETETPLSLILLDADRFKPYNDLYGHPAGDEVLRQIGRILTRVSRDSDIPARYGGEEFAVLLPETDAETAAIIADLLRGEIAAHAFAHREVTASFGVADLTLSMNSGSDLVSAADAALYRSKAGGRNRVTVAETSPPP